MLVNQNTLGRIIGDDNINDVTLRVLLGILRVIGYDGGTAITQQELARLINKDQAQVSKALKILEENDIIYRDGRSWYVDDSLVFKGVEHEIGEEAPE